MDELGAACGVILDMCSKVRKNQIEAFWAWFVEHENKLAKVSTSNDPELDWLLQNLQQIERNLYFEICTNSVPRELILTVQGCHELFPLVDVVVTAAPRVEGWRFIALKPGKGFDFQTNYEGVDFDPRSMWFLPLDRPSRPKDLGLRVGIPNFDQQLEQRMKSAVLVILDSALGERAAALDVQHVEVTALPAHPESEGYIKLTELPDYIDWRKRRFGQVQ